MADAKISALTDGVTANGTDKIPVERSGANRYITPAYIATYLGSTFQPLDSDLTAIAALTTTSFGRAFLALADANAGRTALGLGTAAVEAAGAFDAAGTAASAVSTHESDTTNVHGIADTSALLTTSAAAAAYQPLDSDLTAIAALSTTSYGRSVLALADAAALRSLGGMVIGTNVQAFDAELSALAGLTSAADKGIQFTGSGTAATYDLTTAGKALLDDANAAAQLTTLGISAFAQTILDDADAAAARTTLGVSAGVAPTVTDYSTASGSPFTYTIPTGATFLRITAIGGGGGGGSGRRGAAGSARFGGGGGGSGAFTEVQYSAAQLGGAGTALSVTVGAGGAGSAAKTTDDTDGTGGTTGGATSVSVGGTTIIFAGNGTNGSGGTAASGGAGNAGTGQTNGSAGGASSTSATAGSGTSGNFVAAGAGAGGGIDTGDTARAGGNGGFGGFVFTNSATTVAGGAATGANGTSASAQPYVGIPGKGGGGGGARSSGGVGGTGGNGGVGAGGGGGGASVNGQNSGAGGNGGDGFVRIVSW